MTAAPKTSRTFIMSWLPVMVWFAFIFFMSTGTFSEDNTFSVIGPALRALFPHLTPYQTDAVHAAIRKGAHLSEYFVLGLLLVRALRAASRREWTWRLSCYAMVGVVLWALGDEFHQTFVLTREPSLKDVAVDTAGGLMAQLATALWFGLRHRNRRGRKDGESLLTRRAHDIAHSWSDGKKKDQSGFHS
jgi:VanZ family protein